MNSPFQHHQQELQNGSAAVVELAADTSPDPSKSRTMNGPDFTTTIAKRKNKKKKQGLVSDTASSASSNNCSSTTSSTQKGVKIFRNPKKIRVGSAAMARKSVGSSDVDALGLPLGMSIAAVVAQVLERKNAVGEIMSVDYLSGICSLAVRESLGNVFGDKFDNFVTNFEKSFRSTLMTLRLISDASQRVGAQQEGNGFRPGSCSISSNLFEKLHDSSCLQATDGLEQHEKAENQDISYGSTSKLASLDRVEDSACTSGSINGIESLPHESSTEQHERAENEDLSFGLASILASLDRIDDSRQFNTYAQTDENVNMDLVNKQLVLHDNQNEQQPLSSSNSAINQYSMISTIEKSVREQTRSNDLKTFEIGLVMKKLQLKERQLELHSSANRLNKMKLSMGVSKESLRAEKFKTQLEEIRHMDFLKKCLDMLVAGLVIMLSSLAYGTYVYSHQKIVEATEACSPYLESRSSWWMPKSVSSFNSGLQFLKCQIQVFSRMLFGILMVIAVVVLLIQRSAASHHTMPVTFIVLLLGIACGSSGKLCIDTLGGSGNRWLFYWEAFCMLHFLAYTFHSMLFVLLNGPITVAQRVEHNTAFPYWMRRALFYGMLLFLPFLCGFMPYATPREWFNHFSGQASDFITYLDD